MGTGSIFHSTIDIEMISLAATIFLVHSSLQSHQVDLSSKGVIQLIDLKLFRFSDLKFISFHKEYIFQLRGTLFDEYMNLI